MPPTFGPPSAVKPASELLGDILLGLGRTDEAAAAYTTQLARTPRRVAPLLGLVRAAHASGDTTNATNAHRELAKIWRSADEDVRKDLKPEQKEGKPLS